MPQTNEMLQGLFEATDVPADKQAEFVSIFEAAVAVEAKTVAERVYEAVVADAETFTPRNIHFGVKTPWGKNKFMLTTPYGLHH